MGNLKNFTITLEDNKSAFYPGEKLKGKVVVDVAKPMQVKCIRIRSKGRAEVTMFVGDYDTQRETYFSSVHTLFGVSPKEVGEPQDVQPGLYEYPFSFRLPKSLPHSFLSEGDEQGCVVYTLEATIHRPGKFTYSYKRSFNVHSVLDLNIVPYADEALSVSGHKDLKFLGWDCGKIEASFSLPQKGYVPGQTLEISCQVNNASRRSIRRTRVCLMQVVTLSVYGSTTTKTKKVKRSWRGPIAAGVTDTWTEKPFDIPDVAPSYLKGCELIDVQYLIKFVVVPSGPCRKLKIVGKIFIGTLPLSPETAPVPLKESHSSRVFDYGTFV